MYVDDFALFGPSVAALQLLKDSLAKAFDVKDLGEASLLLGIRLLRLPSGAIRLDQSHYVKDLL